MCSQYPGLEVVGTYCPPFDMLRPEEDEEAVEAINSSRPDIVWVGLGAPKQEKWMAEHAMCIDATAMIGVGAAFDFHTGNVKWAPWIVRKAGMEWAYRLICEPRRMWRRNLDSPLFLAYVTHQLLKRTARQALGKRAVPRIRSIHWDLSELTARVQLTGGQSKTAQSARGEPAASTGDADESLADRAPDDEVEVGW
jgi:hypothetical protein